MSLERELKLLGIEKPTKEQLEKIKNAVEKEKVKHKIMPFMLNDELKITMYIIIIGALAHIVYESMFFIDEREDIKHQLKHKFKALKHSAYVFYQHFEKEFLNQEIEGSDRVKEIYSKYQYEFMEMIYEHFDTIQSYAPYRKLFPQKEQINIKKIQGLKWKI